VAYRSQQPDSALPSAAGSFTFQADFDSRYSQTIEKTIPLKQQPISSQWTIP
jgi:hypothetical protein